MGIRRLIPGTLGIVGYQPLIIGLGRIRVLQLIADISQSKHGQIRIVAAGILKKVGAKHLSRLFIRSCMKQLFSLGNQLLGRVGIR